MATRFQVRLDKDPRPGPTRKKPKKTRAEWVKAGPGVTVFIFCFMNHVFALHMLQIQRVYEFLTTCFCFCFMIHIHALHMLQI
ncbi:transmembrane protein, putative [Medicago truncatula]|uniref:Transmembrane protein, putative n=1 Tax=Medicago truncatula TaxID=3880 RepID=A0A072VI42_MEDTR|nr:transmembrane protein, putative [Medicago truncatula]